MDLSCPASTTQSFTTADFQATYGNGTNKLPLLPAEPLGNQDRDDKGLLTETAVNTIVANLKTQGIVPTYNNNNQAVVDKKQKELIASAKEEFCFYYIRYKESLKKLFEQVSDYRTSPSDDKKKSMDAQLEITRPLNKKLNDLIQIIMGVTNEISKSSTTIQSDLSTFQANLEQQQKYLMNQHKTIASSEAITKLNKEMVKYTEQKARYTNNLLNVYSVLNVVTLGLLFYVFRSTTD